MKAAPGALGIPQTTRPIRVVASSPEVARRAGLNDLAAAGTLERVPADGGARVDVALTDALTPTAEAIAWLTAQRNCNGGALRLVVAHDEGAVAAPELLAVAHLVVGAGELGPKLPQLAAAAAGLNELIELEAETAGVGAIDSLPSMPGPYYEFVAAVRCQYVEMTTLAEIIERDTALAARVLSLANSAFCGLKVDVVRLGHAVSVLGIDMLSALVTVTSAFRALSDRKTVALAESLWVHSKLTAELAERLVHAETDDAEVLAASVQAALLHDIGRLVIAAVLPQSAGIIESLLSDPARDRLQAEHAVLGATHAQIGAWLMTIWGLPDATVAPARWHHDMAAVAERADPVTTAIAAANALLGDEVSSDPDTLRRRAERAELPRRFGEATAQRWVDTVLDFLGE